MTYKLLCTDVDGSIKPFYGPVDPKTADILRELSNEMFIVMLSGRTATYLDGLAVGIGIDGMRVGLVGEEGCIILFPKDYKNYEEYIVGDKKLIEEFLHFKETAKSILSKRLPVYFSPTRIILTLATRNEANFNNAYDLIKEIIEEKNMNDKVYFILHKAHYVISIAPAGINKGVALRKIMEILNVDQDEIIAIGDGLNDIPMFKTSGYSIAVGSREDVRKYANIAFDNIIDALHHIRKLLTK